MWESVSVAASAPDSAAGSWALPLVAASAPRKSMPEGREEAVAGSALSNACVLSAFYLWLDLPKVLPNGTRGA